MAAFDLDDALEVLRTTPAVLRTWLTGRSDGWIRTAPSADAWSPFDVVGHLIHGEKTDWIPRARHLLAGHSDTPFVPFDRFAQLRESEGMTIDQLLDEFAALRQVNVETLEGFHLTAADLDRRGVHPELGAVTLRELLATWVVHDHAHVAQIARAMAQRYADDVGPWRAYLTVLRR
jgi:hypothetical protein